MLAISDGDQSFRLRVFSLTSFSPTSCFADETKRSLDTNLPCSFSHDTKRCDTLVYNSFFGPGERSVGTEQSR